MQTWLSVFQVQFAKSEQIFCGIFWLNSPIMTLHESHMTSNCRQNQSGKNLTNVRRWFTVGYGDLCHQIDKFRHVLIPI